MIETSPVDVLNALTANIAVLDQRGIIVGVNEAWKRFARENGAPDAECYVGTNYFSVCECALDGDVDGTARAVLDGLGAVMRGEAGDFFIEYPCHSPSQERWFCLRATRVSRGSVIGIVVAHEDITARKKAESELEQALARERILARTDSLTGAFNRRHFFDLANQEFAVAHRYHQPLSLILFDIDHFKNINDRHGHDVGDETLCHVAAVARDHLREADVFARYGGEEFIVLLPQTPLAEATLVAERMRVEIADLSAPPITISSGVAELRPGDESLDVILRRADDALYRAKQEGRNRTVADGTD